MIATRSRLLARLSGHRAIDVAGHHATIDPIRSELRAALSGLAPQAARIPILSTVEGVGATPSFDAEHWAANLRHPVRFSQAVTTAAAIHTTFIEISPHPLLTQAISDTLADVHHHALGTLARDTHDTVSFHTALSTAHTLRPPDTEHPPGPHPHLPTTPWQHTHHWITTTATRPHTNHTLLGIGVTDTSGWTTHATATLERGGQSAPELPTTVGAATELDPTEPNRRLRSVGQQQAPAFQGIEGPAVRDDEFSTDRQQTTAAPARQPALSDEEMDLLAELVEASELETNTGVAET